ncbi:MAG TPA: hypothetical protein VF103_17195 [Polyangiaceae bacterium]
MSTKNLSRTVIEGGRRHGNRAMRRHSNASDRVWERMTSQKLLTAIELDDVSYRPRQKVFRDFSDKLAPAERWLRSQVGRPWNKVRSELFARFDTRTTAGRHILFDHLLRSVQEKPSFQPVYVEFTVDAFGILREPRRTRRLSRKG